MVPSEALFAVSLNMPPCETRDGGGGRGIFKETGKVLVLRAAERGAHAEAGVAGDQEAGHTSQSTPRLQ